MTPRPIRMLGFILVWLIGPACVHVLAAPPSPDSRAAIETKITELTGLMANGRIDAMLDRIGPTSDADRPALEETRQRLSNLYGTSGKYAGFDIAGYKSLTPKYQVVYVLVYFEKRPILFELSFYAINDAWRPQRVRVTTDFKELLDTMPLQK